MKTLTLIATRDYQSNAGKFHAAGTVLATIVSDLSTGELAQELFSRTNSTFEVSQNKFEELIDNLQTAGPVAEEVAEQITQKLVGEDTTLLSTLIEGRPARLFAKAGVRTIAELAAWIAEGNRPSDIVGIGDTIEAEILNATGFVLPVE